MSVAPVILFTYNRLVHTQKTISLLQKNEMAAQTPLFVYSDGAKTENDKICVAEVRDYLKTIDGFASVSIVEREQNIGLAENIIRGVSEIVNRYNQAIVVEDDLLTSPYFLRYMNEALKLYEKQEEVISIHGYVYPLKAELPETFFIISIALLILLSTLKTL